MEKIPEAVLRDLQSRSERARDAVSTQVTSIIMEGDPQLALHVGLAALTTAFKINLAILEEGAGLTPEDARQGLLLILTEISDQRNDGPALAKVIQSVLGDKNAVFVSRVDGTVHKPGEAN